MEQPCYDEGCDARVLGVTGCGCEAGQMQTDRLWRLSLVRVSRRSSYGSALGVAGWRRPVKIEGVKKQRGCGWHPFCGVTREAAIGRECNTMRKRTQRARRRAFSATRPVIRQKPTSTPPAPLLLIGRNSGPGALPRTASRSASPPARRHTCDTMSASPVCVVRLPCPGRRPAPPALIVMGL